MNKGFGCVIYMSVIFLIGLIGSYYFIFQKDDAKKANSIKPELIKAIKNRDADGLKEIILKNKKVINADHLSDTALIYSVYLHNKEALNIFLDTGADPNYIFTFNSNEVESVTPLMLAADLGYSDIAEILLKHKAGKYSVNQNGQNALAIAVTRKFEYNYLFGLIDLILDINNSNKKEEMNSDEYRRQIEVIKLLIDSKDKNSFKKDNFNKDAYDYAVKDGNKEILNYLANYYK